MEKVLLIDQVYKVNIKYTYALAYALLRHGVNITVGGVEDDRQLYEGLPFEGLIINYSNAKNPIQKVFLYYKSWKNILRHVKENGIDIVHLQWYIFSPLDWKFIKKLKKRGVKVVTTIHDLLPFNKKFYDFRYHKKIYNNATKIINQSKVNERVLVEEFKVSDKKVVYIPHGHFMEYAEAATKEESIKYLNLPSDKKIILFFGQVKKVKGVDILIKALRLVVEKHPDVYCVIAGKVWKDDFTIYKNLIDELALNDFIRADIKFIPDDDVKYYFNASDMVVLPYRKIYQSGVVLLACAYEKPVIATTEGEFLNVIKNGETGLLVNSENESELAEAIDFYLVNPEKSIQFAKECKKDLSVRLSWDTIAEKVIDIYKSVLDA